jgi:hypothetical protein
VGGDFRHRNWPTMKNSVLIIKWIQLTIKLILVVWFQVALILAQVGKLRTFSITSGNMRKLGIVLSKNKKNR